MREFHDTILRISTSSLVFSTFYCKLKRINFDSDTPRRSLLDAFFDLKSGRGEPFASTSTSMQASSMTLKDGKFSIEVDIQVKISDL